MVEIEALDYLQHALAIQQEALGPCHPGVALSVCRIGSVLYEQGQLEEALDHFQRAVAIWQETLGPHHPDLALSLAGMSRVALAQRDTEAAREHAERAVFLLEAAESSPVELALARFTLARALWSDRSQRTRARTLAEHARDAFAELGNDKQFELAKVEQWLAEHPTE